MLPVTGYLFPSLGLGILHSYFFQDFFKPIFSFFSFWNLYNAEPSIVYIIYPIDLICCFGSHYCLSVCCFNWVTSIILSSRSLVHSSILFNLLFIAFSSVFISAIKLVNFDWFLFIVSTSLLKGYTLLSINFLNPCSIFIASFLNSASSKLEKSISLFALSGDFFFPLIRGCSSAFPF